MERSTAVGCGHDGATDLQIPGLISILRGAGDGDGVDAGGITVTGTVIALPTSITCCPNKNGAQTSASLCDINKQRFAALIPLLHMHFHI